MATVATLRKITSAPAADGRVRRSQRSGDAIVAALLALVGEGVVEPTAQQVAVRAGVGIRTVFRRFADMESFFAEMDARIQSEVRPLLGVGRPAGTLVTRARALVERRTALFERIAPYKRSGNAKRWRSPFLQDRHASMVRELRKDLLRSLPELQQVAASTVDALDVATSFEVWDRLRTEQRLGRERARATMEQTVLALVAGITG